jgi:hypothetical protein
MGKKEIMKRTEKNKRGTTNEGYFFQLFFVSLQLKKENGTRVKVFI